jgi:hypothetical protein
MMTLDPEIIDFELTKTNGVLTLKDNAILMAVDYQENAGKIKDSVSEKFNKANLAYYSNLFSNMNEVYGYLQNLLFVFVGMFFIGRVGFDKGLKSLDKSRDNSGDTQWLSKFYIPVVTVGFFFAPIPEDADMNATLVQKMIRFMTLESNAIADRASAIGVNTYMQRLYSTVGAVSIEGEANTLAAKQSAHEQEEIYKNAINEVCNSRFKGIGSYLQATNAEERYSEMYDINNITKSSNPSSSDITFEACRVMEYRQKVQEDIKTKTDNYLKKMEVSYKNDKLRQLLIKVNESLQQQQDQLGWPNAFILPSMSILIESLPLVTSVSGTGGSSLAAALSIAMSNETIDKLKGSIDDSKSSTASDANMTNIAYMIGNFAYMTLPGARGIYEALSRNKKEALFISSVLDKEQAGKLTEGIIDDKTYLISMSVLYQWMITKLPIVVSVIAGIIAFIGYVVELAKYFYISPFVAAFSLTTRKTHKIVDFLVTGLTVFFRPILLVIFIFFALFIHTLIQDIFVYYTLNQFNILAGLSQGEEIISAVIGLLKVMLQIFASLGATYIMWKLILTGPAWAMKLVGVDNAQNDMISEALSQRMDRAAFRM